MEPHKKAVYNAAPDLEPGSYEWVLQQDQVDTLMKQQPEHARRLRASKEASERDGDAMLRLLRMKISVKDIGMTRSIDAMHPAGCYKAIVTCWQVLNSS